MRILCDSPDTSSAVPRMGFGWQRIQHRDPHGVNPAQSFLTCLLPRRYGRRPFPPRRGKSSALPAAMSRRGATKGWLMSPTVSPTTPRVAPLAPALKQREMLPNGALKRLLPPHPHTAAGSSPSAHARRRHPPFPSPRPHSAMAPAGPGASQAEPCRPPPPENGRRAPSPPPAMGLLGSPGGRAAPFGVPSRPLVARSSLGCVFPPG